MLQQNPTVKPFYDTTEEQSILYFKCQFIINEDKNQTLGQTLL